jgi:hypothetical protein
MNTFEKKLAKATKRWMEEYDSPPPKRTRFKTSEEYTLLAFSRVKDVEEMDYLTDEENKEQYWLLLLEDK